MSDRPVVTIGMPVYNAANYLSEAIESLLNQTYTDFELIISDNASTDRTAEICRRYAEADSRIKYTLQPVNLGAIRNFNFVFEKSRGKFFKWASHDDVCEPTFLERCATFLEAHKDVVWCHCKSDMIDAQGRSWKTRLPETDDELERDGDGNLQWKGHPRLDFNHDRPSRRFAGVLLGTNWCVDSYGLIRSDALRKTRMLLELYGAEKILLGELSLVGKMGWIPEMLFSQRIHTAASSYVDSSVNQKEFISARNSKPFLPTRIAIFLAHATAVRRAELSRRERSLCVAALVRYLFQFRKWKRVALTTLRRQSVGGGGKRIIDAGAG